MKLGFIFLMTMLAFIVHASSPTDSILDGSNGSDVQDSIVKGYCKNGKDENQTFWTNRTNEFIAMLVGMVLSAVLIFIAFPANRRLQVFGSKLARSYAREAQLRRKIENYEKRERELKKVATRDQKSDNYSAIVTKFNEILNKPLPRITTSSYCLNVWRFILACVTTVLMAIMTFDVETLSPNIFHNITFAALSVGACSSSAALLEIFRWKLTNRFTPNLVLNLYFGLGVAGLMAFNGILSFGKGKLKDWDARSWNRHFAFTVAEAEYMAQQGKLFIMGMLVCNMLAKCSVNCKQSLLYYSFGLVACVVAIAILVSFTGPLHLSIWAEIAFIVVTIVGGYGLKD